MLLTTCPNCSAQFKVQPEQLNVRQGRVMCGRCREIFNAFQSLARVDDPPEDAYGQGAGLPPGAEEVVESLDVGDALFLREEPSPLAGSYSVSPSLSTGAMLETELPTPAARTFEPFSVSQHAGSSSVSFTANVSAPPLDTPNSGAAVENPLLTSQGKRRINSPPQTRMWVAGACLLFFVFAAQLTYVYRGLLAQTLPESRLALVKSCELIGCKVPWGRDDAAIRIEASDLIETPAKPGSILLTATIANRGGYAQDYPSLELKLTDNSNQVLISRVFAPSDYLGRIPSVDEALAANAELFVNVGIEVAGKLPASGYGVRAYYP